MAAISSKKEIGLATEHLPGKVVSELLVEGVGHSFESAAPSLEVLGVSDIPHSELEEILAWARVLCAHMSDNRCYSYRTQSGDWQGWLCSTYFFVQEWTDGE